VSGASEDRVFLFALRLERLPALRLDHREIIGSRLVAPDEMPGLPLTGPVRAYVDGWFALDAKPSLPVC
jgi:hypothetical protein